MTNRQLYFGLLLVFLAQAVGALGLFEKDDTEPVVVRTDGASKTVKFGPVLLKFPSLEGFKRVGAVHEVVISKDVQVAVSVSRTSVAARAKGYSPAKSMGENRRIVARTVSEACGEESPWKVEDLPPVQGRPALLGYCTQSDDGGDAGYYIQYQVYSERTVVLMSVAGYGQVQDARRRFEPMLLGQEWGDEP